MVFLGLRRGFHSWFRPAIDAVFNWNLAWKYRWRLLALQPLALLTNCIGALPFVFRAPFTVEYLPVAPGRELRVLVYRDPSPSGSEAKPRPLHLDIHGGAFVGGLPENSARFCTRVARETGAVVISTTYRYAPVHHFPAAHDDVDAVLRYLRAHGPERYGIDPGLVTTSGFSAGANLAIATARTAPDAVKASVTFYAPVDLRLPPMDKPRSAGFPKRDPMAFLLPLFDSYPAPVRAQNMGNPRMSPILAALEDLPENMLLVVAGIDIIVHEQTVFIKRLQEEAAADKEKYRGRRFEAIFDDELFHGALERK